MHNNIASFKRNSQFQIPPGGKYYLVYSDWNNQNLKWETLIFTKTNNKKAVWDIAWPMYLEPENKAVMAGSYRTFHSQAEADKAPGEWGKAGWQVAEENRRYAEAEKRYSRSKDPNIDNITL